MISISKRYGKLTPKQFEAWFKKYCPNAEGTWEYWYAEAGGKLPKLTEEQPVKKDKPGK